MEDGVLQDMGGNTYGGLSDLEYYFNVTDSSAPIVSGLSPAHASADQSKSSAIVLTFNEVIQVCMLACIVLW